MPPMRTGAGNRARSFFALPYLRRQIPSVSGGFEAEVLGIFRDFFESDLYRHADENVGGGDIEQVTQNANTFI